MSARVGFGFDLHRLVAGRRLRLGGVAIPWKRGLLGHSDGDAVLHAVASALLGAIGAGDLGQHFSDRDPRWRGADSRTLVAAVMRLVRRARGRVENVDVTVVAEAPRLEPYNDAMRAAIAALVGVPAARVNVKATTFEGLGPIGRGQAIAAYAVVAMEIRAGRRRVRSR